MFSSYNIEKYNFDGVSKDTRIFNIDFDLSIYNNFLYSEKVSDNFMLDTFALEKYDNSNYYHIPLYVNNIINPFLELPPTQQEIEIELNNFKSGINGFTGSSLEAGDLLVSFNGGFSASFNVNEKFGYITEIDYEMEKIKMLVKGISGGTANNSYRILRKENNEWIPIVPTIISGFVILPNVLFVENFSNSPVRFQNQNGIVTKDITISGYSDGSPDNGYISISEKENLINDRNFINIPSSDKVKVIGDLINGTS